MSNAARGTVMKEYKFLTARKPAEWTFAQATLFLRVMWGLDYKTIKQGDLANLLNDWGVKTKNGKEWTSNTISYSMSKFSKFTRKPETIAQLKKMIEEIVWAVKNSPAASHVDETSERLATQPIVTAPVPKLIGDVLGRDLKGVSDEDLATALETLATSQMDPTVRKLLMVQTIRGIRHQDAR